MKKKREKDLEKIRLKIRKKLNREKKKEKELEKIRSKIRKKLSGWIKEYPTIPYAGCSTENSKSEWVEYNNPELDKLLGIDFDSIVYDPKTDSMIKKSN